MPSGGSSTQVNPQPMIASLLPSEAPVGGASQTLTIQGSGFVSSSTATYNGTQHDVTFTSSKQISILLSKADLANIGNFAVAVTNPSPGGGQSKPVNFKVQGGTLQVEISGLPSGTAGNVSVTSATGFNATKG